MAPGGYSCSPSPVPTLSVVRPAYGPSCEHNGDGDEQRNDCNGGPWSRMLGPQCIGKDLPRYLRAVRFFPPIRTQLPLERPTASTCFEMLVHEVDLVRFERSRVELTDQQSASAASHNDTPLLLESVPGTGMYPTFSHSWLCCSRGYTSFAFSVLRTQGDVEGRPMPARPWRPEDTRPPCPARLNRTSRSCFYDTGLCRPVSLSTLREFRRPSCSCRLPPRPHGSSCEGPGSRIQLEGRRTHHRHSSCRRSPSRTFLCCRNLCSQGTDCIASRRSRIPSVPFDTPLPYRRLRRRLTRTLRGTAFWSQRLPRPPWRGVPVHEPSLLKGQRSPLPLSRTLRLLSSFQFSLLSSSFSGFWY